MLRKGPYSGCRGPGHIFAVGKVIGASLAASVVLPLTLATKAATTTWVVAGLVVLHLTIGAAVIPAMARTARSG